MSYTLRFSDPNTTTTITVLSKTEGTGINNYDTSLDLIGAGYTNYGQPYAQNFLKLLENFSSPSQPDNPIKGQLWYDTSASRPVLRINNGSSNSNRWPSANGIYQQTTDPSIRYAVYNGDVWVDTGNNQLKIRYSENWTVVGPALQTGTVKSGTEAVIVESNTGDLYPVIKNWVNDQIVEIISYNEFIPRTVISGFSVIKIGTNLTSKVSAKYNGLAEKASALQVSPGVLIQASEVLKNNATSQTLAGSLYIQSADGLSIRPTLSGNAIKIYSDSTNGYVNFAGNTLRVGTSNTSFIKFNSQYANVGINTTPSSTSPTLDVNGGARFNEGITINSGNIDVGGKGIFSGALSAASLRVNGLTTSTGKLTLGSSGNGVIIEPAVNDVYDIGTASKKFRSIYVSDVYSETFNGSFTGSASSLTSPRYFSVQGQVTATSISFNGTADVTFDTTLTRSAISSQGVITTAGSGYTLLVLEDSNPDADLQKITKANFLSDVYSNLFVTGMIVPFGSSTGIPTGFLVCDGSTVSIATYPDLYAIIGTTYGSGGAGTFKTPDMSITTEVSPGGYITYIIKT